MYVDLYTFETILDSLLLKEEGGGRVIPSSFSIIYDGRRNEKETIQPFFILRDEKSVFVYVHVM